MDDPIATEYRFTLPVGYLTEDGVLLRDGVMRLATAADEINSMRDHRVQDNPAYQPVVVLSRVLVRLGTLEVITPPVIEKLYMADFNHLLRLYEQINQIDVEGGQPAAAGRTQEGFAGNVESLPLSTSFMRR